MLDRLASRAAFWGALTVLATTGGLASLGEVARADSARVGTPLAPPATQAVEAGFLSLLDAAPLLSVLALGLALTGWWLLSRETARRGDDELALRQQVRRLHDAMHASADGVFLLRALRNEAGEIADFVLTDVNPTGARLMRASHEQLVGRRLHRDLPLGFVTPLLEQYADAIALNAPLVEDVRVDPRRFAASWLMHQAVPTADGVAVTIRDITARKREELRLRRASLTDHLTLLYNRRGFMTLAEQHLRIARRQEKDAVLLYVDMDEFKQLNDTYGHAVGDKALAAVGRLLRRTVRDCDVVARMGGDEFTIMALDADGAAARLIQRRIEERIALLNASAELPTSLSLTIGYTRVRPTDEASLSELLGRADQLLYARKRRRKLTVSAEKRASGRRVGQHPGSRMAPMHSPAGHGRDRACRGRRGRGVHGWRDELLTDARRVT
jgi:diguanylate cyclase (GGDEF)-like protein